MIQEEIILTKHECNWILNSCGEFIRSGITHDGISIEESDWRTCYEYTFTNNISLQNLILSKLQKYGVNSVPNSMSVVRYESGQYFKNHIDSGIGHEDRIKTISIQLSDISDYNGGDLLIWESDEDGNSCAHCVSREIGNMVLFDSKLNHEAVSIESGTRYILVFWLTDENLQ